MKEGFKQMDEQKFLVLKKKQLPLPPKPLQYFVVTSRMKTILRTRCLDDLAPADLDNLFSHALGSMSLGVCF